MYRFIFLVISVIIIVGILFIAKTTGNPLDLNSSDFYLNLLTEIIGITVSVLLLEIFGTKIVKYIEMKKNKSYNTFLYNRLKIIIGRLKTQYRLLSIDMNIDYGNSEELKNSIDINYIQGEETRGYRTANGNETQRIRRPKLFFKEFPSRINELEVISSQLPQGLPNDIYEGILMLLSQDSYMWGHMQYRNWNYNEGWVDTFKDLLFDKYLGLNKLMNGHKELEKLIK